MEFFERPTMYMHRLFLFVLIVLTLATAGCSSHSEVPVVGQAFPYAKFTMFDGTEKILTEWKGKPIVVMFWSVECPSCKRAIARLNENVRPIARNTDVVFLADSVDTINSFEEVRQRTRQSDFSWFQHAFSGNDVNDEAFVNLGGDRVPYIVLINRSGTAVYAGRDIDEVVKFVKGAARKAVRP